MSTKKEYYDDPYKKEGKGRITFNEFTDLIVDNSVFFPTGYGQQNDRGMIVIDGKKYEIIDVFDDGEGIHLISYDTYPSDCKGKEIEEFVNWEVRYNHMKFRTAMRILACIAYKKYGASHRINQTYEDYGWIDIEMDDISEEKVRDIEEEANRYIKEGHKPSYRIVKKEDFLKDNDLVKTVNGRVPEINELRLVKYDNLPEQMEMGLLVNDTKEVGTVKLKTNLVKGKVGTRITVNLVE
ncbi:alanyl-tRNA editing protein [Caldiplasma sukawensis]